MPEKEDTIDPYRDIDPIDIFLLPRAMYNLHLHQVSRILI